jgi:RND family efflux transporter MFP subunit
MTSARLKVGLTLWLTAILLAGCTAAGKSPLHYNRVSVSSSRGPIKVHVFNVQPTANSGSSDLLIPAALSVDGVATVLAERSGRIVSLSSSEGARIEKGQVLAIFDDEDQRTRLREAELEVSRLKVEEQQYEALVKLSRSQLERELTLAKEGVTSQVNVEQAQYKFEQANHEYEKTKLASASARTRMRAAEIEIEKSTVRAPITGVISHQFVSLGSSVAQNDKLFEVSKLSPLQVKFQVPQSEGRRLHAGETIDLSAVDQDAIIARARIRRIDPVADATSSTFGYLADIISGSELMPGLAVNIHLPRGGDAVSFWVPRAVFPAGTDLRSQASASLFIANGTKVSVRVVLIQSIEGDQVQIISGLNPNESVIVSPPPDLKDQDTIEVSPL